MKYLLVWGWLFVNCTELLSQCGNYETRSTKTFHANDIRAVIKGSGSLISYDQGGLLVPFSGAHSPTAIGGAGIWIGGFTEDGNLTLASALYNTPTHADYVSGPLRPSKNTQYADNCMEWDVIWSVTRHEVLLHLQDFLDGEIHEAQSSVFGWPGRGNRFFNAINGFALPDTSGDYAPFADLNNNNRYEPDNGEYPIPNAAFPLSIPDQMTWHVFNDFKVHTESQGEPLGVEVRQTTYAFHCEESSVMSRALFMDFQVELRDTTTLDSVIFALVIDPDLGGCPIDDFVGYSPSDHASFIYNRDKMVDSGEEYCNPEHFDQGPGVFSFSYLNREMSSFMYYASGSIGSWPNAMTHPRTGAPLEFYRMMTGSWRIGTPLTEGASGYNPGSGNPPTQFAFPGNPNDSTSWSMLNESTGPGDFRMISSTKLGRIEPGQVSQISVAFALHLDTTQSHSENIELMYEELPYLKAQYVAGFTDCSKSFEPCMQECVWPGDANHDGIANHLDILHLGLAYGKTGIVRNEPLSWAPHPSEVWTEVFQDGLNMKHADMNGDGIVDLSQDRDILNLHYGLTHDNYVHQVNCAEGEELIVEGGFATYDPTNFEPHVSIKLNTGIVDSLYGLAFTVVFDTFFFAPLELSDLQPPFDKDVSIVYDNLVTGVYEYAVTRFDGKNQVFLENPVFATFSLPIKEYDLVPFKHDTAEFCIANAIGFLADGTEVPLGSNTIYLIFLDQSATAVPELKAQGISVYPNPATGLIHFAVPSDFIGARYSVRLMSGQLYTSRIITNEVTQLDLLAGMYVLSIRSQDRLFVEKIVVLE